MDKEQNSMNGKDFSENLSPEHESRELIERKKAHLEICLAESDYRIEDSESPGYTAFRFIHDAMPELAEDEIDTTVEFLGCRLALPLFISCMTGGTTWLPAAQQQPVNALHINRQLAMAAQKLRIPVGLGSIRALFARPEVLPEFAIKPLAPDVPVLANLGIVQLRELDHKRINEMLERLNVQAVVIHLNPGQELIQPEGARNFRHLKDALQRFCAQSALPVIVKETGNGIKPSLVKQLFSFGVSYVDLAGAGGTNWMLVEGRRNSQEKAGFAREFDSWGIPTALIQAVVGEQGGKILASGGIRTGMDVAKALALGARLAGLALPLVRAVVDEGVDGVVNYIRQLGQSLRTVMILTGARTLSELGRVPMLVEPGFFSLVEQLKKIESPE